MFDLSKFERILFPPPQVQVDKLLRVHGYRKNHKIKPVVREAANQAVIRLKENSSPQGFFFLEEIECHKEDILLLKSGIEFKCRVFEEMLANTTHLISFIISLGKDIDKEIKKFSKNQREPLASFFMETAGRLSLELILRESRVKIIEYTTKNGMKLGNRMAPGYSYPVKSTGQRVMWDLEQQFNLFNIFNNLDLPVELIEGSVMLPRMSRSGIFGIRKL